MFVAFSANPSNYKPLPEADRTVSNTFEGVVILFESCIELRHKTYPFLFQAAAATWQPLKHRHNSLQA